MSGEKKNLFVEPHNPNPILHLHPHYYQSSILQRDSATQSRVGRACSAWVHECLMNAVGLNSRSRKVFVLSEYPIVQAIAVARYHAWLGISLWHITLWVAGKKMHSVSLGLSHCPSNKSTFNSNECKTPGDQVFSCMNEAGKCARQLAGRPAKTDFLVYTQPAFHVALRGMISSIVFVGRNDSTGGVFTLLMRNRFALVSCETLRIKIRYQKSKRNSAGAIRIVLESTDGTRSNEIVFEGNERNWFWKKTNHRVFRGLKLHGAVM